MEVSETTSNLRRAFNTSDFEISYTNEEITFVTILFAARFVHILLTHG
jgi:hypothetical protein